VDLDLKRGDLDDQHLKQYTRRHVEDLQVHFLTKEKFIIIIA
jgi:predicted glycosyltransferase involved in capsule biosynthesis